MCFGQVIPPGKRQNIPFGNFKMCFYLYLYYLDIIYLFIHKYIYEKYCKNIVQLHYFIDCKCMYFMIHAHALYTTIILYN